MARTTADTLGIGGVVVALTYLSLVVGELVPKRLALAYPERAASRIARPLAFAGSRSACPWSGCCAPRPMPSSGCSASRDQPAARVTEEEIRALLAEGAQAGVVQPLEHELIEGVMQHRRPPGAVDHDPAGRAGLARRRCQQRPSCAPCSQLRAHSRYPVCRGGLDELVGIVHVRQLLDAPAVGRPLRPRRARQAAGDGAREHVRGQAGRAVPQRPRPPGDRARRVWRRRGRRDARPTC